MRVRPGAEEVTDISSLYSSQVNMNMVKATTLFEDDAQNLWIGCAYQGIVMLPHQQAPFHFFNLPTTLSDLPGQIYALYADSQNWIWCAIEDNGLYRLDTNGHITLHIQTPNNVSAIYQDSKSSLWVGINGKGLYSLDPKCGTLSPQYPISGAHAVRAITEGPDGQLYVSVLGIGILRYHPHTKKAELISADHSQTAPENLFNNWISAMLCDSSNRLWLGHYGYISCFDIDNNRFMELPFDPKIRYSSCYAIVEGSDHTIWLATRHGLVCYHPDTNAYSVRTVQQGLADNIICGLIQDGKGNLWCSTTQGISFVDGKTKEITNYYSGNGLQDKIYLEGRCTRSADGHIYFGGEKGITGFHPDDIRQTRLETAPFVTDLYLTDRKVNCRTLSGGRQIICETPIHATEFRLSHSDNTFTLYLSMMNYRDAGNVFYEYRLPTLSKIWNRTLPGKSHIQYHHLPPGRYNLELRACENGVYSPVRTIQVRISPPWYASAYAKTGYLLILAGICRLIHIAIQRKRRETIGEMKLQFFINIAHELRSPLTLILNPTESLLEKTDDTNTRRELQTIRYNTSRILRLLDQLLDIRRIDKGQLKLRLTATDMRRLISETADIFTDEARRKAIRLETEFADPLPPVWIDPNNFDKVVVNLLSNALKYTPKGGSVQLSVHTGTDPHTSGPLHDYLEIAVSDTGKGLDEQELTRVFDRFFQGASVPGSAPSGFGIGLNLCQLLVKLHHGSIHAENRTDTCGSRFVDRLPLGSGHLQKEEMAEETAEASAALPSYVLEDPATTDQKQHGRTRTNYRVLIIDDDPSLCGYLRDSLSPYYRIETATDGNEGLRKAVRMEPDLIVSDVLMPNMDGIRLLKELKKNTKTCHIPIILLTTQTESANRIEGLTQGADAYLDKPFHLQELDTLIMNLITNRILLKGKFSGNQTQEKNLSTVSLPDNDQMLMDKIIKAINENLSNPELNVEFLTKEVGISRSHLHRRLKDMTGLSMGDFIRNLRLHQAAVLLRNKKNPIAQITYAVGFTSQSYFSKAFKKFYGMTPTEYRETSEAEQDSIDSSVQESGAGSKERIE